MIAAEALEMNPGGETVITRLADILVVHAIRHGLTHSYTNRTSWLGALRDRQIGPVISKVHRAQPVDGLLNHLQPRLRCRDRRLQPGLRNWSASLPCGT